MNFTFPRTTLIAAVPKVRFQMEEEADQSDVLRTYFLEKCGEEIEITPALITEMCERVDEEYVFEMIQCSDKNDSTLCAAFLITMPYAMFNRAKCRSWPFGSSVYFTSDGITNNPVFDVLWEHRGLDQYNMEEKLTDILVESVHINRSEVEQLVLEFKTRTLRDELCFMCDPNKYVEYLPKLAVNRRYENTLSALEFLTAESLEKVSSEPWSSEMMEIIINVPMTAKYFIGPDSTPHAYNQLKDYLFSCFEDGNYTVDVDGRTAIRCGHRKKLLTFITLNKGEIIDTEYFDIMFGKIDRDLQLKASDKFRRNATCGAYGLGRPTDDLLSRAKECAGQRVAIPYTINPTFTAEVPKLTEGVYISVLSNDSEPLLNQLVPELVEVAPSELETTDAKYVMLKFKNVNTLSVLKDMRALTNYVDRNQHQRVVIVPAVFEAECLAMTDNVYMVYEHGRDKSVVISSKYSRLFSGREGRRNYRMGRGSDITRNVVAYKSVVETQFTSLQHFI